MAASIEGHSRAPHILPTPTGPFTVGCVDISIESYPLMRLYYPTIITNVRQSTTKWIPHPNYTEAYLKFLLDIRPVKFSSHVTSEVIAERINSVEIPAEYGAPFAGSCKKECDDSTQKCLEKYPVIMFSHGRGGMRTRYSATCCDLASHGYIVAVPEHCDGSSCLALRQVKMADGEGEGVRDEWINYELNKGENESEFEFRNNQVLKRVSELQATRELLCLLNKGSPLVNMYELSHHHTRCMQQHFDLLHFKDHILVDDIALIGHSFGGATILQALSSTSSGIFKCGIALDPWMMPLSEELFQEDIKQPLLFINSAHFYQTPESVKRIMTLVKPPNKETGISQCQLITIDGTVHLSQVDSAFVLGEYFLSGGKEKPILEPSISHSINMRLCWAFLKRFLILADDHQVFVPLLDGGGSDNERFIIYGTNIKYT